MENEKYKVGMKIWCNDICGEVIQNFKMPGDICVQWETGLVASYDQEWLEINAAPVCIE